VTALRTNLPLTVERLREVLRYEPSGYRWAQITVSGQNIHLVCLTAEEAHEAYVGAALKSFARAR
jgi:hypothetical protein